MLKYIGWAILAMCAGWLLAAPSHAGVSLASHRAVYDLRLDESKNAAGLASADGRMAFEISGSACEGWTVNFRMVNRFRPSEEKDRVIDTRSSSWESGDGLQMRYTQSEFVDNVLDGEKNLSAKRDATGGPGSGELTKPSTKTFELGPDVIFPVQHQLKLMAAAAAGASRDASTVYDGSDDEKPFRTISFIGRPKAPGESGMDFKGPSADALSKLQSWPVSISYFSDKAEAGEGGEQTPIYQVSFEMFANGVATQLTLNYGDFSLRGNLTSLEFIDQPDCK